MVVFSEGPQAQNAKYVGCDEHLPVWTHPQTATKKELSSVFEGPSAREQIKGHMSQRVESEKLFFRQAVGLGTRLMLAGLAVGLIGMLLGLPLHLASDNRNGGGGGLAPWQGLASYLVQLLGVALLLAGVVVLSACPCVFTSVCAPHETPHCQPSVF